MNSGSLLLNGGADDFAIHVAGTVRDCGEGLGERLVRLEKALGSATSARIHFHLHENDSTDTTRDALLRFQSGRPGVTLHLLDGLVSLFPRREERLAYCRNQLLSSIRAVDEEQATGSIYFPVDLDIDVDWSPQIAHLSAAIALVQSGTLDGVFPASRPLYYDIHALRAEGWSPGDPWLAVSRARRAGPFIPRWILQGLLVHSKQVPLERLQAQGRLIPVDSAFGGFGVYLFDRVREREYVSTTKDRCEHVAFNRGLRLAIMPELEVPAPSEHLGGKRFLPRHRLWILKRARSMRRLPRRVDT